MSGDSRIHIGDLKPGDIALLKTVAEEAAEQAVRKTFTAMGFDPAKPNEAQADMVWLRATRERCQGTEGKAIVTLVGLLVLGVVTTFWQGLKSVLH